MNQDTDINILIVDDEIDTLVALKRLLRKESYAVHFVSGGIEALEFCKHTIISIVITDLRMPEMSGMELIENLKIKHPDILRIILSGTEDIGLIIDSINTGQVFRFIPKPIDINGLKSIINDAINYYRLLNERKGMLEMLEKQNQHLIKANDALRIMTAELRESEMQFRAMNDAAFDPIFLIDHSGFIVYVNRAAENIFQFNEKEFRLKKFIDLISTEYFTNNINENYISFESESDNTNYLTKQIYCIKKDGSLVPFELTKGTVILNSISYTVIIARDITTRIEEERSRLQFEGMQQELEMQIEKKLLQSHIPNILNGASLSRFMMSSGHLNGDFAEFIVYDKKHADILLGDVMGHGILSALVGAGLKSLYLKTVAQIKHMNNNLPELQEIVSHLHDSCILELLDLDIYATLLFIRLDLENRNFSMIDCGHTPTIHFHAKKGCCALLKGKNLPVGMIEKQEYKTVTFPVEKNDIIVLYSDGITESRLPDNTLFGQDRLCNLISTNNQLHPDDLVNTIKQTVISSTGKNTFDDDASCVVIRIGDKTE